MPATLGPVATWFPPRTVRVADLPEVAELPAGRRQHLLSLGIDEVRCADGLSEVDLAGNAAKAALDRAGIGADDLSGLVLVQGRAPDYLMASEATRLQARIGASRAFTLSVGELGCVSVSAALSVGAGLPGMTHVLVASGVRIPTPRRYRPPMTVLGDGGAAVVLSHTGGPGLEIVDHLMESDGRYADLFRIDYRASDASGWVEECADERVYTFRLAMDSRARFLDINDRLLRRNGLRIDDMHAVLTQNLARGAYAFWQDVLGVPVHQSCAANLARYGHVGPIDVLLNLGDAARAVPPGGHVLVMNSSPVAAWSSTLLRAKG